jgi:protein O-mannosyl-transferase
MPRVHAWVLERQQYWPKELARLRATLRDDAARKIPSAQ